MVLSRARGEARSTTADQVTLLQQGEKRTWRQRSSRAINISLQSRPHELSFIFWTLSRDIAYLHHGGQ